jgi:hypothetical protein
MKCICVICNMEYVCVYVIWNVYVQYVKCVYVCVCVCDVCIWALYVYEHCVCVCVWCVYMSTICIWALCVCVCVMCVYEHYIGTLICAHNVNVYVQYVICVCVRVCVCVCVCDMCICALCGVNAAKVPRMKCICVICDVKFTCMYITWNVHVWYDMWKEKRQRLRDYLLVSLPVRLRVHFDWLVGITFHSSMNDDDYVCMYVCMYMSMLMALHSIHQWIRVYGHMMMTQFWFK